MLRFKIYNLFFSSSVASCQQAMVIVPARASSGSKPSGATEFNVSGAIEPDVLDLLGVILKNQNPFY